MDDDSTLAVAAMSSSNIVHVLIVQTKNTAQTPEITLTLKQPDQH